MNPKKCAFGVSAGQFLGFLVHERGIEIGLKSQEAVRTMVPPTTKRELQQLIGKINFIRRFISNLSGRIEPFIDLVKIKADEEFHWGQNNNEHSKKSKNIWQDRPCWFLPGRIGRSTFICQWVIPPSPQWWYKCMTARKRLCFTSAGECRIWRPGTTRWRSYVSVCHLNKVAAHLALCRDNRYLQIRHHQAYAIGSCLERPAQEMDVRAVRIRYSVSTHKGSQGTSIGRPDHRNSQY
jgi:hypothetical protein